VDALSFLARRHPAVLGLPVDELARGFGLQSHELTRDGM
jgi:hypothetical protein